jgi:hypothetical protein
MAADERKLIGHESSKRPGEKSPSLRWLNLGWLIAAVHFAVAVVYKDVIGLAIDPLPSTQWWDFFWQTIPLELLREDALVSIWYTHAQPPLFNLYGAALIKLFYPKHLEALNYIHILMGSLLSGMLVPILWCFTMNRRLTLLTASLMAFNPALFLYS